jgi:hypothetical protein
MTLNTPVLARISLLSLGMEALDWIEKCVFEQVLQSIIIKKGITLYKKGLRRSHNASFSGDTLNILP